MTRVMLTGAGGFVGSHVLRHLLANTDWDLVCPVTYRHKGASERVASSLGNLPAVIDEHLRERVQIIHHDLTMPLSPQWIDRMGEVDVIMNVASESHVDRSIEDPVLFVMNNTSLILNLLEYARVIKPRLFLQMSTDEVYGPAPSGYLHREGEPHRPSNPYSASKSCQESIAFSYWRTYDAPVVITNTMNIFGEMQDPEKYLAKVMRALARKEAVTVHGWRTGGTGHPDGSLTKHWGIGSRFYLHARNLADAWLFLTRAELDAGLIVEYHVDGHADLPRFNIVGEREVDNLQLATMVAQAMGIDQWEYEMIDFHSSRPGHDLRYALDGSRLASLGWKAPVSLEEGIRRTVRWTLEHREWL